MAHERQTNALGAQLLANAALALAHSRGVATPARVKVVLVLDHPTDEPAVATLTADQRAAITAGAEVAFMVRTPDAAEPFAPLAPERANVFVERVRAKVARVRLTAAMTD